MATLSDTPVYPLTAQDRWKKRRIDFEESPSESNEFDKAAEQLVKDESLPLYARTILAYLIDTRKQVDVVLARNRSLIEENEALYKELSALKAENARLKEHTHGSPSLLPVQESSASAVADWEEFERLVELQSWQHILSLSNGSAKAA